MSRQHHASALASFEFGNPVARSRVDPGVLLDLIQRIKSASTDKTPPQPAPQPQPLAQSG